MILSTTIDILQEELQDLGDKRGIVRLATKTLNEGAKRALKRKAKETVGAAVKKVKRTAIFN